jgi:HlyD family secretion protein
MPPLNFRNHFIARHRLLVIAALLVVLIAAIIIFSGPKPIEVKLVTVEKGNVEATVSNTRSGTVKACRRAKMAPPVGGQISQLLIQKGQRVKEGQPLLILWRDDLQAQDKLAREQLNTAQNQGQQACVQADLADKDAARGRELREQGFISPQALDKLNFEAKAARAGCDAARGQVSQSHSRIAVAQATLNRMTLRAPFAGIVADISGEQGEFATPSPPGIPTPPVVDLIDDSCMYVSAPIDEVDAAYIKVAQPSRITLDAIKGKSFAGQVRRIAPYVLEIEKQARTVEVEVEFNEPPKEENLLVGYSADVEIIHQARPNVLRIPTQALLEGKRVLLYRPADGKLEAVAVTTGLSNWSFTEITSGLHEGDRIVLSLDRDGVKAGVRVKPETESANKAAP